MREEYELEVLEHYDIVVRSTRKIRGAFFCETDKGTMLLKETKISEQRARLLYAVLCTLDTRGNIKADIPVPAEDGGLLTDSRDGRKYMLKKWYQGRECDVRQERDILKASEKLAVLHRETEGILSGMSAPAGRDPVEEIRRHNRELKKVRGFIRNRVAKNEFEYLFLENFEKMYKLAEEVLERMEDSGCSVLWREGKQRGNTVHGEYNYHNLIMTDFDVAVVNFEHLHAGTQLQDLYYFLRKTMEKYTWKQKTGREIVDAYNSIRQLSHTEREYVGLRLAYPEKYWKTARGYYQSNKAWLPQKYVEKLQLAVRQNEEKKAFLQSIFSIDI